MKNKELQAGKIFAFSNEAHQDKIGGTDVREAEVEFNPITDNFTIFFNGACIHASATFRPLKRRLAKLVEKWNLKEI
jgi:hypothetical protein